VADCCSEEWLASPLGLNASFRDIGMMDKKVNTSKWDIELLMNSTVGLSTLLPKLAYRITSRRAYNTVSILNCLQFLAFGFFSFLLCLFLISFLQEISIR